MADIRKIKLGNTDYELRDVRLDTIINKKIVFIGDSYGKGWTQTEGVSFTPYPDRVAEFLNIPIFNISESGAGFANIGDSGHTFSQLVSSIPSGLVASTVSDVYVCGGYNDKSHTQNEINNGIIAFVNTAKAKYPNAKIHCGFVAGDGYAPNYGALNNARQCYMQCSKRGVEYLTGIEQVMTNLECIYSDNIHPNEYGHSILAIALAQSILGRAYTEVCGFVDIAVNGHNGTSWSKGLTQEKAGTSVVTSLQEKCIVSNLSAFGSVTLNGASALWIGDMERKGFTRGYEHTITTTQCIIHLSTGADYVGFATVMISNGGINVYLYAHNGSGFVTGTVSSIELLPFKIAGDVFVG